MLATWTYRLTTGPKARFVLSAGVLACCFGLASATTWGGFQANVGIHSEQAQTPEIQDLQEVLEIGLKARRPVEFQFIARVVLLVESGDLPRKMVEGTFLWARRESSRPFPYFQRGLRTRARRIGVAI